MHRAGCGECGDPHDRSVNEKLDPKNIGKHPVDGRSWSDGSTDIADVERWFPPGTRHNVAIVPGLSRLFVVDIDGEEGEVTAAPLDLPETLEARTGNGRHLYFACDDVETIDSKDLDADINTRARNGYVIAPPSRHRSGRYYEWKNWVYMRPVLLPPWIAERNRHVDAVDVREPIIAVPVEGISPALAKLLAEAPGNDRSDQHFAFVGHAVDDGLSDGQILTLVRQHAPSFEKYGTRLEEQTQKSITKIREKKRWWDDLINNQAPNNLRRTTSTARAIPTYPMTTRS